MKITLDDQFWVVTNPTDQSELADIFFWCNLRGLENQIYGSLGGTRMTDMGMTIHTVEISAREDAETRLAAR